MGRGSHLFLFSPSSVQVVVLNSVSHQSKCSAMSSIYVNISCINWKSGSSSTKHNGSVTFLPSLFSVRWSVVDKICCAFSLSLNRAEKKYRIKSYFALLIIAWFISLIYTHIYKSTCFLMHHILFTTSVFHPSQNKLFWVKKVNGDFSIEMKEILFIALTGFLATQEVLSSLRNVLVLTDARAINSSFGFFSEYSCKDTESFAKTVHYLGMIISMHGNLSSL